MQVTVELSDDIIVRSISIDLAWELYYLYIQAVNMTEEDITETRRAKWSSVEASLKSATDGCTIDFRPMGDIYFTNGGPYLDSSD